jgi:hypothetical protein
VDWATITVDHNFLQQALTIAMQMRGDIDENAYILVHEMSIDEETGYLNLTVEKKEQTVN